MFYNQNGLQCGQLKMPQSTSIMQMIVSASGLKHATVSISNLTMTLGLSMKQK